MNIKLNLRWAKMAAVD